MRPEEQEPRSKESKEEEREQSSTAEVPAQRSHRHRWIPTKTPRTAQTPLLAPVLHSGPPTPCPAPCGTQRSSCCSTVSSLRACSRPRPAYLSSPPVHHPSTDCTPCTPQTVSSELHSWTTPEFCKKHRRRLPAGCALWPSATTQWPCCLSTASRPSAGCPSWSRPTPDRPSPWRRGRRSAEGCHRLLPPQTLLGHQCGRPRCWST